MQKPPKLKTKPTGQPTNQPKKTRPESKRMGNNELQDKEQPK